ncbi:fumarylacetoacetate hydrolase family protein [Shewanella maritima]|uniref:fumarylacetoacetate hydrolase family protein n=1 Tax=Shewanella maritima TaxID=2520507 RepID=UPI0026D0B082
MNSIMVANRKVTPSKVVCIGRNYVDHIKELANEQPTEPVIFIKPNSAISQQIVLSGGDEIHYEGEICFAVQSGQLSAVGFGLDLTKRQVQSQLKAKGLPWERAKAFNGSAIFSDFVTLPSDITELHMELYINEKLTQAGDYAQMIFKPAEFLADISNFLTLEDGDVIMSGTQKAWGK